MFNLTISLIQFLFDCQDVLEWEKSREFFYWHLRRRLLENEVKNKIRQFTDSHSEGQLKSMISRWFVEDQGAINVRFIKLNIQNRILIINIKFTIVPLISPSDIVSINLVTLLLSCHIHHDFFYYYYYIYITPGNYLPLGARKPQRFTNICNEQYN